MSAMDGCNMPAWHYTTGTKLDLILAGGVLRPTDSYIPDDEKPILWFSSDAFWEPTANKMILQSNLLLY